MELRLKVREANSLSRYRPTFVNPRVANGSDHPQVPLLLHLMVTGMKGMFINRQQPRVSDLIVAVPDRFLGWRNNLRVRFSAERTEQGRVERGVLDAD